MRGHNIKVLFPERRSYRPVGTRTSTTLRAVICIAILLTVPASSRLGRMFMHRRPPRELPHLPRLRREALCYIPGSAGRDSKGGSWV
jgi:hypothetical protein